MVGMVLNSISKITGIVAANAVSLHSPRPRRKEGVADTCTRRVAECAKVQYPYCTISGIGLSTFLSLAYYSDMHRGLDIIRMMILTTRCINTS